MEFLHRIADYFSPERAVAEARNREVIHLQDRALAELRLRATQPTPTTDALNKLADAAITISNLRNDKANLRKALLHSRDHVIDVYDDALAAFEALPTKSKKRVDAKAVLEAVKSDLTLIASTLFSTLSSTDEAKS